ncbi:MAG TPA: DUF4129 domain-containing protein [Gaiellaceae bacterium]|nr:DUF4129 domain-containing protein [Gaiellaceae bacterium]
MSAPSRDTGFDPLRAGGAVLAVLALLAVDALAASAGGPATGGADRDLADPLATLLFVFGGIWVAALLVASPIMSGLTLTGGEPKPRRWQGNVLAGVFFFSLVLAGIAVLRKLRPGGGGEVGPAPGPNPTPTTPDGTGRVPLIDPATIDWLVVGLVFVAALVGFAILAAVLVRPKGRSLPEMEARRQLGQMLDETLDDLYGERDPRRAVIAAYARMERSLGSYGLPRRPAEAPLEYLGRVLAELTGSASAARRLTRLFERAKFSEHTVDARMKEDAIAAVAAVRDELRALTVA